MNSVLLTVAGLLVSMFCNSQCFTDHQAYKNYLANNEKELDPIEGIWVTKYDTTRFTPDSIKESQRFYIVKHKNYFVICRPTNNSGFSSNEKIIKKKNGKYLYSKYTYNLQNPQYKSGNSSFTSTATLTDNKYLTLEYYRTKRSAISKDKLIQEKNVYDFVKLPF